MTNMHGLDGLLFILSFSFGMRNVSKIDSFSHSALVYGKIAERKP